MASFPLLSSGAVTQYPARRTTECRTRILRYADGSEQRFPLLERPLRKWRVNLAHTSPAETAQVREFFRQQVGRAGTFQFVDPWTGVLHERCRLDADVYRMSELAEGVSDAEILVAEVIE